MKIEKEHKKSTLMNMSKDRLSELVMCLEYNNNVLHGTIDQQYKNFKALLPKWIPVTERLPEDKVNPITRDAYVYPVTVDLGGATDIRYYSFCRGHWYNQGPKEMDELVIAWQERPEPYKPE